MSDLTEQQIEDLFKDAPEEYNYYMPENEEWCEAWFMAKGDTAIKTIKTISTKCRVVHNCSYSLHSLLEDGAIKRPEPKEEIKKEEPKMIKFDLEKALAGEKVITRDGQEVTQLVKFDVKDVDYPLLGVLSDNINSWQCSGRYNIDESEHALDLFMVPKKLSGFIAYCSNNITKAVNNRAHAEVFAYHMNCKLLAVIDVSTIEEGEGL